MFKKCRNKWYELSEDAKTEIKNLKEIPVCNAEEIGNFSITYADDINKLGNCAFEVKKDCMNNMQMNMIFLLLTATNFLIISLKTN